MTLWARLERWWKADELVVTINRKGSLPRTIPFKARQGVSCSVLKGGGTGPVSITIKPRYL